MTRVSIIAVTVWLQMLRRKDLYVLAILLLTLLVALVSLNIFGLGGAVRYVLDIGLLMAWVFGWVLAISISARQIPQEEERGTIFPLLAKPITRFELIVGKWLGAWTIVAAATAVFYAMVSAVSLARGAELNAVAVLQGYVLHTAALAIISALALALSTRLNPDAAVTLAYVLTGASFFVVPRIPAFIPQATGVAPTALLILYHALPHFEIFDMRQRIVYAYGPASWGLLATILIYGLLVTAFFVLVAWLGYRNKRFSRGSLYG
jgi:ABC-type transport system involved in multi-copper enzyme maturation permease subunit